MLPSIILTGLVSALVASSHPINKRQAPPVISRCIMPNTVALTFDDGPGALFDTAVNMLNEAGAIGTFFVNGDNERCIYDEEFADQIKRASDQGHQILSHTWSHPDLNQLSLERLEQEFGRAEEAIHKITGLRPAFTRPPFGNGADNATVLEVAKRHGQRLVLWDFDSQDSIEGVDVATQLQQYTDLIASRPFSVLPLHHDTKETTVLQVLPHALTLFKEAGYRLVSLSECLNLPSYLRVDPPAQRDETWVCPPQESLPQ